MSTGSGRNRALIYMRSLAGHRQIYLRVLLNYFLYRGFSVVIATNIIERSHELNFLADIFDNSLITVEFLDKSNDNINSIIKVQKKYFFDVTIIADADYLKREIMTSSDNRMLGNTIFIFLYLSGMHILEVKSFGVERLLDYARNALDALKEQWFFRYKFFKLGNSNRVLVLDPRFVNLMQEPRIYWLPDIYKPLDEPRIDNCRRQDSILEALNIFISLHKNKDVILYFGTNQTRRGYDWLLKLVADNDDLIFVHCGRLDENIDMSTAAREFRKKLNFQGRLFETKEFLVDDRLVDRAYSICKYVLLPYIGHYGSSGVLLQAISYNKPVLVPDVGLMDYWVSKYQLGMTFRHSSYQNFLKKYQEIRVKHFASSSFHQFSSMFSKNQVYQAIDRVMFDFGLDIKVENNE